MIWEAHRISSNFSSMDFHHLMGLGKLKDLRVARKNRAQVFSDILAGRITHQAVILASSKVCYFFWQAITFFRSEGFVLQETVKSLDFPLIVPRNQWLRPCKCY